jgi:hypothetical protein
LTMPSIDHDRFRDIHDNIGTAPKS